MPHQDSSEYTKSVGQDKPTHEVINVYDAYYGTYKVQAPAVKPGMPKQMPAPFTLEGK